MDGLIFEIMSSRKKKVSELDRILKFVQFTITFQQIQRMVRATGEHRWENDAEHSYQLAIVAWYIINSKNLPLDLGKVLKYAIVHDLPEIFAGDACAFVDSTAVMDGKHAREMAAIQKLRTELPEFSELHDALHRYEDRADPEAKFVYALDKVLPMYVILLDEGKTWRQFNTGFDTMLGEKAGKIRKCPHSSKLLDTILAELDKRQGELFPPKAPPLDTEDIIRVPQRVFAAA